MATSPLQRRITVNSAICGTILAVVIVICNALGLLQPLEWWLYDVRALTCQFFTPAPSEQIVHIDIDDEALETIGPWPWRRSVIGSLLDELRLASPKAVAIDVLFTEPQRKTIEQNIFGSYETIDEDAAMVEAVRKLGCVVLPVSLAFIAPGAGASPLREAALSELEREPTLDSDELVARLYARGFSGKDVAARVAVDYPDLVREAVHRRIRSRLELGPIELKQLQAELDGTATTRPVSPATSRSSAGPSRLGALVGVLYERVRGELAILRFSAPVPAGLGAAPPDVEIQLTPLAELSEAAVGCGFVDYAIFKEPTIRAVPLFVKDGPRLYPQFGLEVACRMLGIDASAAKIEDDAVTLPATANRGEIRIPVRSRYSSAVKRDIGLLMDIPWFGGREWKMMYDWPEHRKVARHYSTNIIWDIVDARAKLSRNNVVIDKALIDSLFPTKIRGNEYAARKLPIEDFESRKIEAEAILRDLHDSGADELLSLPESQLSPDDRKMRDAIVQVRSALEENPALIERIERKRRELLGYVKDKAVFVGWVATGTMDIVPTSLHARCPGVVVHGVIVNAILNEYFLKSAPRWATILLTLLFGLLSTALTSRMEPIRAVPLLLLIAAAYFTANGLIFYGRLNLVVDAAAPLIAMGVCWGGCMVVRVILEGLERIRMAREAAVIDHEISLARQVQAALIPKVLTILAKVDSHGWTLAATTTGGDCFDLWRMADGRLGILVADASGHGLGPSIIVSEVRALVRALCDLYTEPQKLLERVNHRLAADLQGSKFCTAFVGFLGEDGKLSWGSAGHGPMLWAPTCDAEPKELEGTGLPLGVSDDWFGDETVPVLELEPTGWLGVFSDGIFEAPRPDGQQFGIERIKETIRLAREQSCENIVARLREEVTRWQVVSEPADDQTIVFLRLLGAAAEAVVGDRADPASPAETSAAND